MDSNDSDIVQLNSHLNIERKVDNLHTVNENTNVGKQNRQYPAAELIANVEMSICG